MHNWGDETFDWKALAAAEEDLHRICTRYGRLGGQIKEKYGTLRFYADFRGLSIHSLLYPGWYNRGGMPEWLFAIDQSIIARVCNITGLSRLFTAYQRFFYRLGYRYILRKYPHIREEIASCADYPELFAYMATKEPHIDGPGYVVRRYYDKDGTLLAGWIGCK